MHIPLYQVDAFTREPFAGNPAAVCLLEEWLPDATLQAIAAENNLSETAFLVALGGGWELRWFTPVTEVDLCGHATLASAHVLFRHREVEEPELHFETRSGVLRVRGLDNGLLVMTFPSLPPVPVAASAGLAEALGTEPGAVLESAGKLVAVLADEAAVRALRPDFAALGRLGYGRVMVTAPGSGCDFVSRYFAPGVGIPEDPVTGSAHCVLAPFWSEILGKTEFHARQLSKRGGDLWVRLEGDRVKIAGHSIAVMQGTLSV